MDFMEMKKKRTCVYVRRFTYAGSFTPFHFFERVAFGKKGLIFFENAPFHFFERVSFWKKKFILRKYTVSFFRKGDFWETRSYFSEKEPWPLPVKSHF